MIGGLRVAVIIPAYNEADRVPMLIARMPAEVVDLVVVVNDCSTDGTGANARQAGATVIDRTERGGPGSSIRDGLDYLRGVHGEHLADVVAVMAANGKHSPEQVPDLVRPIAEENLDLVRGSRYLAGGHHENMPGHRQLLIRLFTLLFVLFSGRRVTDATGGFQAYRIAVLDDPRIDLHQGWIKRYEMETYLFAKLLLLGYRWKEVPITITYPQRGMTYTRARPILDWWGYFRPVVLLGLRLRH